MGFKSVFSSLFPFILFAISFYLLFNSSIILPKIIESEYKVFEVFMNSLKTNSLASSFQQTFNYLWNSILLNSLLAMALIATGTVITIRYIEEVNYKLLILGAIAFLASTFFITNSIELSATALALVVSHFLMIKFFEQKKYLISTGFSYVKRNTGIIATFLSLSILSLMVVNANNYEKAIHETTVKGMSLVLPDKDEITAAQKEKVKRDAEFIRSYIKYSYNTASDQDKQVCQRVYTGCLTAVSEYEKAYTDSIEKNGVELAVEDIQNGFPIIKSFEKATPLFISIFVFSLLSVIVPVVSVFGGLLYLILKTVGNKKSADGK